VTVASRVPWFHAHNPRHRPVLGRDLVTYSCGAVYRFALVEFHSFYNGRTNPPYRPTAEVDRATSPRNPPPSLCLAVALEVAIRRRLSSCEVRTLLRISILVSAQRASCALLAKYDLCNVGPSPTASAVPDASSST